MNEPTYCLVCDGTDGKLFAYDGQCYTNVKCPKGTTPNEVTMECDVIPDFSNEVIVSVVCDKCIDCGSPVCP